MHYLYTGDFEILGAQKSNCSNSQNDYQEGNYQTFGNEGPMNDTSMEYLIEFLQVADEYLLEQLKEECECRLSEMLSIDNFVAIKEAAEKFNAEQLLKFCHWFERRHRFASMPSKREV